jgi:hypothetical protein
MVLFRFAVTQSFLNVTTHPITIPRSQVDYKTVEASNFDRKNITVILPRGERINGHLYSGSAGYGPYFQIRLHGENRKLPTYFKIDDKLIVLLFRVGARSYATLEYRE